MDQYFVIISSEDGVYVEPKNRESLLSMIEEKDYGNLPVLFSFPGSGPHYWEGMIIIKGKMVTPVPVTEVTSWTIE